MPPADDPARAERKTVNARPPSSAPDALERPGLSTLEGPRAPSFEPNRVLRWIYGRFFRHMKVDETWSGVVRESATAGVVVYVMRTISVLDFLCLDYLVKRFRLPLVRFVNDLGLWILEPFGRGERRLRLRRQIPQPDALAKVLHEEQSALLFLRRPPSLGERRAGRGLDVDLIRTLVEQQRKIDRPIRLVPQTFVWTKRPSEKLPTLVDLLFGPSEWPGRFRVFLRFLFNFRNAELRSGKPFDVAEFLDEHQDLTDGEAADRIRYALLGRIEREQRVILGPKKKTAGRIREELLRSPRVRPHIEKAARDQDKPVSAIEKQADRELRRLCAMMDPAAIGIFQRILSWVFTRIYDGFVVDQPGIERVREAARRGPLVLLPSHKSHVDYLVLSYVLADNSVSPPLIAAGDNLSFFPLGPFLRRSGAFFIRRSFQGRRLYAALVDAYVRKILVEGFNLELFMEGGRSRTGKLLPPKLGLLSMVIDAALQLPAVDMTIVPVSIGYERIIEQRAYTRELGGGEKKPENIGGLLRSTRILRSRYGRLYIQFGELMPVRELLSEARDDPDAHRGESLPPAARRALINRVAHRATYEIDRATIVTPAALVGTALMSHDKRGMRHEELMDRAAEVLAFLRRADARIARSVVREGAATLAGPSREASADVARETLDEEAVRETLALFVDAGLIETDERDGEAIHTIPGERRLGLEYHLNTVIHFFVPSAMIASALLVDGAEELEESALRTRVARLSRLFKYEFMYRADAGFDTIFDDALGSMIDAGELVREGSAIRAPDGSRAPLFARLLATYFEAYRLSIDALDALDKPFKRKDWVKRTLARGEREFLAGDITLRESLSRPKIDNALSSLHDHGFVKLTRSTIEPGAALKDSEARAAFSRRVRRYCPG